MQNDDCFGFCLKTYEDQWFWEIEEWKTMTVLLFCLKTYENHKFGEIEEWKTITVLLFCLKTNENHLFWEIEEWKTMTVLLFCLKTYENRGFWDVEEHHAGVLDTSGPAKLCWHMVLWLQDSSRASKPMLVHAKEHRSPKVQADSEVWGPLIVKTQLLRI